MKKMIMLAAVAMIASAANAQESDKKEFDVQFQLRPRAEYRNGQGSLREEGAAPAEFISNRARLSLGYKSSMLDMKVAAQHVGTWGADGQQAKDGDFIMNEAWAKLHSKDNTLFAQFGRQSLVYDDERILGGLDWAQTGRYHDALKLGYENSADKLHLILAFNQNDEKKNGDGTYYDASKGQPYKAMQTLWYHHQFDACRFGVSILAMNLGWETGTQEKADTKYMQTLGTHLTYNPGAWKLDGSFYYQLGENAKQQDVNAYTWNIGATTSLSTQWGIDFGLDFRSGVTDDGDPAFDQLYGTHHKFYGAMDYWLQNVSCGLLNPHAGVSYKFSDKVNLSANYHYFIADSDLGDDNSQGLGHEIDLQLNWKVMKDVTIQAGYSTMLAGESMQIVKGGNYKSWQDWGWISFNINPQLFKAIF